MKEKRRSRKPPPPQDTGQNAALAWLTVGLAATFSYFFLIPLGKVEKPISLVVLYLLAAVGLDLFVGASRRVTLQRIAPGVVLALLVTPGIPPAVALVVNVLGTIVVASASRITWELIKQSGKALIPATLTAFFLATRPDPTLDTYFFAAELFLLASLFTRTTEPPFRSDLFLVVSYPAIALMLRSLADLHVAYVLLAVPLLFLMTTVDTEMLLRYFQLQKTLDDAKTEVKESRKAHRKSELESRRKGVLLNRKEQQIILLNGLGREMNAAQAAHDLAIFLLKESIRLTGADSCMVLFCERDTNRVQKIISPAPKGTWGISEGQAVPPSVEPGISEHIPWAAPIWGERGSFLCSRLGEEGWLILASRDKDAFPKFLADFFTAVGRHAGSAVLALRRLEDVREIARREALEKKKVAQEKENVAAEKEKVAEQNRNLRLLIENFEGLTEEALSSDHELLRQATQAIRRMTGAEEVIFQAREAQDYPHDESGLLVEQTRWGDHIFVPGEGPSGNLLCLARGPESFSSGHIEWCTLLQDFLDKTMENGNLHRRLQESFSKLERTQEEVVRSSQWAAAGRLAANAAHELNTPLGAIRLAAEQTKFFLKPETTPEPAVTGIDSILRSVDRCRQVTDRLLITSRPVDRGDESLKPEKHALLPIVKDALASVKPYLRASGIKVADHRLVTDYQVEIVIQDLYWAVVNVLKNGIDALNEADSKDKRMALALTKKENFVEITIADNGPGVPEEVKKKMFEPFFTTKKLGQGNGLGLSLSRTNLRRWGGDLEYRETTTGGATFVLTVPLADS